MPRHRGATCFECGLPAEHFHHVVPKIHGGTRTLGLCLSCHSKIHGVQLATSELIKAGQRAAKARGVHCGRPKISVKKQKKIKEIYAQIHTLRGVAKRLKISPSTVSLYLREVVSEGLSKKQD